MRTRNLLSDFSLANPVYSGATVQVFTVDPTTLTKTSTLAPLYGDMVAPSQIANPQTLDGSGKWQDPVYTDVPVIMSITGNGIVAHSTGIINAHGRWAGEWSTGTTYFADDTVRDGAAGSATGSIYICQSSHVSGAWLTDVGAGKWSLFLDARSISFGSPLLSGDFYSTDGAIIGRVADRVLIGAAVDNPGHRNRDDTPTDWLSTYLHGKSIGAWPVWGAQAAVLARYGSLALVAGSRTSDAKASATMLGYTPASIALAGFALNDDTTSPTATTAWAAYFHAMRASANVNYRPTFSFEAEVANYGDEIGGVTPYSPARGGETWVGQIASGGGDDSGTVATTGGLRFVRNPTKHKVGILFVADALKGTDGSAGDTGYAPAIMLARNQGIETFAPDGGSASIYRSTIVNSANASRIEHQEIGIIFYAVGSASVMFTAQLDGTVSVPDLKVANGDPIAGPWTVWNGAVVTSFAGSFVTVSNSFSYRKIGRTVLFRTTIFITDNGTAAGYVDITLPFQVGANFDGAVAGREVAVGGQMLQGSLAANSGSMPILKYDNTYPGGAGTKLVLSGVYEAAV